MIQNSWFALRILVLSVSLMSIGCSICADEAEPSISLDTLKEKISSFKPDPKYRDDEAGLVALQEALVAAQEGNYGTGACLIREETGEVVQRGHKGGGRGLSEQNSVLTSKTLHRLASRAPWIDFIFTMKIRSSWGVYRSFCNFMAAGW